MKWSINIVALLIHILIQAQTLNVKELNIYFDSLEINNKFMGSVALIKDGLIIYNKQLGYTNIETKSKPDINTKYRIGSISKTFTATLIFKAIEEGHLKLNTTLFSYFPSLPQASKTTVQHLLNHNSGIGNYTDSKNFFEYNTQPKTRTEMLSYIIKSGQDFAPGSKHKYSNSNYLLLSYILEDIYNKSYAKILEEKISKPLELKNTYLGKKINLKQNETYSYAFLTNWQKQQETHPSVALGAGSIVSTPSDLLQFANALFSNKIISEHSVSQMAHINKSFGFGLFALPYYDKFLLGHDGKIDGFNAVFGYLPDNKIGFAHTSNGSNYDNNHVSITLLNAVFNKPIDIPSFTKYQYLSKELDLYTGVYSKADFPLKIRIFKKGTILFAQATGQSEFSLTAIKQHQFKFDPARITMIFNPDKKELTLKQNGGIFVFKKD